MLRIKSGLWFVVCACVLSFAGPEAVAQDGDGLTRAERNVLRDLEGDLERLERLIRQERTEQATAAFQLLNQRIGSARGELSPALLTALSKIHERLKNARQAIVAAGGEVPEIAELPMAGGEPISFSKAVAPLLVTHCGRCHVSATRGQFGMPNYNALMNSGHVVAGQAADSRLIQLVASGEMPRGGGPVPETDLEVLRQWVNQGARSDLDNNNQSLNEIAQASMPAQEAQPALTVEAPSGSETVSFALDIAPILIANCSGCHVEAQQIRGGLNMTNFRGLLGGGDSGRALEPGRGEESFLVKKLKGTGGGQRMPAGRQPLGSEAIDKIIKWIDEGARFDGGDPALPIRTVAARVKAATLSHEQLAADRAELAAKNWQLAAGDRPSRSASNDELLVVGAGDQQRIDGVLKAAQEALDGLRDPLKLKSNEPFVKGKVTLFVFDQRYDFNEFGVMLLGHPLPREVSSVWQFDQVDARCAIWLNAGMAGETLQLELARQLASLYTASLAADVPRWFADGIGYDAASRAYPRAEAVKQWTATAQTAADQLRNGEDLLRGRIAEDQAAWVGLAVVGRLRNDAGKFNRFWSALQRGGGFVESFQQSFQVTLEQLFGARQ